MKYPFMTMPIERPVEGGFIDATCILPDYSWQNNGFSDAEIKEFQDILEKEKVV
jgi:hypothetical protein